MDKLKDLFLYKGKNSLAKEATLSKKFVDWKMNFEKWLSVHERKQDVAEVFFLCKNGRKFYQVYLLPLHLAF